MSSKDPILWGAGMTREEFNEWAKSTHLRIDPAPDQVSLFEDPVPMVRVIHLLRNESVLVPKSWTEGLVASLQQRLL